MDLKLLLEDFEQSLGIETAIESLKTRIKMKHQNISLEKTKIQYKHLYDYIKDSDTKNEKILCKKLKIFFCKPSLNLVKNIDIFIINVLLNNGTFKRSELIDVV